MRRSAIEALDTLGLVHREVVAQEGGIVVVIERGDALRAVELTAYVAGVVHHRIVLERGNGHLLDLLHGEVDVGPVAPVVGVAVEVDLVGLVVGTRGVVHNHHVPVAEITPNKLLIEALRCVLFCTDSLTLSIAKRVGKLRRRLSQIEYQKTIHTLENG